MPRFRGQILHMRAAARDVAFGTDVRALLGTAGADTNFTLTYTSTTAVTQTVDPFTNQSNVATDNRANLGWALNQNDASTDSMGSGVSVSGLVRLRVVPAGSWSFEFAWASNAAALLANYNVIVAYTVYRVAANGGARTELFTATAAATNVGVSAGSGTGAVSSTQPAYVLLENETLHVAVRITANATSAVLGGTTNTVITCTFATSGTHFVTLPAPGLRDYFLDTNFALGDGGGTRSLLVGKDVATGLADGAGSYDYLAQFFRSFAAVGDGEGSRDLLVAFKALEAVGAGVGTRTLAVIKDLISSSGVGDGFRSLLVRKDAFSATGDGDLEFARAVVFVRDFLGVAEGTTEFNRVVIFVRDFIATGAVTIKPRIALDWDDLPNPEGGGEVIVNTYRPIFVFDD